MDCYVHIGNKSSNYASFVQLVDIFYPQTFLNACLFNCRQILISCTQTTFIQMQLMKHRPLIHNHNDKNKEIQGKEKIKTIPIKNCIDITKRYEQKLHSKIQNAYYESFPLVLMSINKFKNQYLFDHGSIIQAEIETAYIYCYRKMPEDKVK